MTGFNRIFFVSIFVMGMVLLTNTNAHAHRETPSIIHSYALAVETAAPAVVNIRVLNKDHRFVGGKTNFSQDEMSRKGLLGSGVIMDSRGYLLTSYHIVQQASQIEVALMDGRKTFAVLIGKDPETDLAVLRIDLSHLPVIKVKNTDAPKVGDVVLAIGNPFGLGQTVTQGIISAIGRNTVGLNQLENYIQTDAAINPGNSGGALVNTLGELIGINTGIYTESGYNEGVGFAIPMNVALNTLQQIIATGKVSRGWIGVEVNDLNSHLVKIITASQKQGVVITNVLYRSPAQISGLDVADVIVKVDGKSVQNTRAFYNVIAQAKPGETLEFTVYRHHKPILISVKVSKRPPPALIDDRLTAPKHAFTLPRS